MPIIMTITSGCLSSFQQHNTWRSSGFSCCWRRWRGRRCRTESWPLITQRGRSSFTYPLLPSACPPGLHGPLCQLQCDCANGASCHPASGQCLCPAGFRGARCHRGQSDRRSLPRRDGGVAVSLGLVWRNVSSLPALLSFPLRQCASRAPTDRDAAGRATATTGRRATPWREGASALRERRDPDVTSVRLRVWTPVCSHIILKNPHNVKILLFFFLLAHLQNRKSHVFAVTTHIKTHSQIKSADFSALTRSLVLCLQLLLRNNSANI